jgi:uncharacterized caspase-like protein
MLRTILFTFLFLATSVALVRAGGRVALVVGVSKYEHAASLPNTLNDAKDMSTALKRLGFDVDTVLDPSRADLEAAVRRYGDGSAGAEASVFYYSGHALEAGGHNWILPATANINSERDLRFEAVDLNTILEQTDGTAKVSIAFLDACRDNPFAGRISSSGRGLSRGLERVELSSSGVLVAFSTAPGQVALDRVGAERNSPFTAALLSHLETAGLEVKSLLSRVTKDVVEETKGKQRPWQNSSLEDEFYFVVPQGGAPVAQAPPNLETVFWDSIKASHNSADFQAYLKQFPKGVFVELARNRLGMLQQETTETQVANQVPTVANSPPSPSQEKSAKLAPAQPAGETQTPVPPRPSLHEAVVPVPSAIANRLDGDWDATISCASASGALAYTLALKSQVKDGIFHGQYGIDGKPGSLAVDGTIESDDTSVLYARGLTNRSQYAMGNAPAGSEVSYRIQAHFDATSASGSRMEGRQCNFSARKRWQPISTKARAMSRKD